MCGRYALAMRPSQVRLYLEERDMPVADAPEDDAHDAPRQSYNFAPSYNGIVYRADVPDRGARPGQNSTSVRAETSDPAPTDSQEPPQGDESTTGDTEPASSAPDAAPREASPETSPRYKLQSMRWGLIPSWTKRDPGYGSLTKTINCRSESLSSPGGMWTTMKMRKRCIVVADGFYEWLKVGPKEKVPHYIKRKDGQPMLFAGLWDCVRYEGSDEKIYTYTIITTDSNAQLRFLHDRMPAILEPHSKESSVWLDPTRCSWSRDLQNVLRPSTTELEIYPVSKEVGKVGNDSPSFIIPVASRENKSNIANFFANAGAKKEEKAKVEEMKAEEDGDLREWEHLEGVEGGLVPSNTSVKREASPADPSTEPPSKVPMRSTPGKPGKISSTSNAANKSPTKSPAKSNTGGSQKITSFFKKF